MTDRIASSTRARLVLEWDRLRSRPYAVERAGSWGITDRPPDSLDDVLRAVGDGGDYGREADRRLRRLVAIAARDDLAGRVVIERLAPGLLTLACKRPPAATSFDELLAAAWIAVRTFNPERRAASIASALLSDAEWGAFRRAERRVAATVTTTELPRQLAAPDADRPAADELAELLADARAAGIERADLELVQLLVATESTNDVAAILDVTSRTVRNRRDRVTRRLRELALA